MGNLTVGPAVEKQVYEIIGPNGKSFYPPNGYCWRFTKDKFEHMVAGNRIWFGLDGNNSPVPKLFLTEVQDGVTPMTLWTFDEAGHNQESTRELRTLLDGAMFTNPKPLRYITRYLQIGINKNDYVLDFFSGSATTAHAVMQLNDKDGGRRKFIMVQLPEETDESSEASKAGYKNICEIGKERIRRAGRKIKDEYKIGNAFESTGQTCMYADDIEKICGETVKDLDIGFRVLKIDSTNMQDVYYNPAELKQTGLFELADNIKSDRSGEDLLFQVMLDLGILLSSKIEDKVIGGKKVFSVADGYLIACFDSDVTTEAVTEIAKMKPYYAVFRDSGMANDSVATNFEQIFTTYSPTTVRKVL